MLDNIQLNLNLPQNGANLQKKCNLMQTKNHLVLHFIVGLNIQRLLIFSHY